MVSQVKGEKIRIYKYKSKKNYHRREGHRQPYTKVEITANSTRNDQGSDLSDVEGWYSGFPLRATPVTPRKAATWSARVSVLTTTCVNALESWPM